MKNISNYKNYERIENDLKAECTWTTLADEDQGFGNRSERAIPNSSQYLRPAKMNRQEMK